MNTGMARANSEVKLSVSEGWAQTEKYLINASTLLTEKFDYRKYGMAGVAALHDATPKDTGTTANSWDYRVVKSKDSIRVEWYNTNIVDYVPIAIILQYGHATKNGGFVEGTDYINPAMKGLFDDMAKKMWKELING